MGENECLGWFPRYTQGKPMCDDVGCATQVWDGSQRPNVDDYLEVREFIPPKDTKVIPKEDFMRELGGKPHKVLYELPSCKVSYKDGQIVVDELTKLPMGITATNMSQDDLKQSGSPILFVKCDPRKSKRKYYKPKFTL